MKPVILIVLFTFYIMSTFGQVALTPSASAFEKKWIKNNTSQMIWYALRDTTKFEMGKVITQTFVENKRIMVVTQVSMKNIKAPWIDTTEADRKTLKPIRHASYNMQRDMVLNFGKVVTGFYTDKMKKTNTLVNDTTTTDYFDSNLYPVLLGWLPFKDQYTQEIAIYDYNPGAKMGVIKAYVKNVSSGTYQSDKNGPRNVWIVTVSDELGNGQNGISVYYFDKVDRKLWKQEIDANGRKMMMKLVE